MNARKFLGGVGLVTALALTACGGGGEDGGEAPAGSGAAGGGGEATTLQVSAGPGTALAFAPTTLSVPANQPFTVEFNNPADTQQPHNFAIVDQGTEDAVGQAALPELGNIPDNTPGVQAAGDVIQAGNSEEIEVEEGLPAGTYTYICTYPGHTASMRGTLTVQ